MGALGGPSGTGALHRWGRHRGGCLFQGMAVRAATRPLTTARNTLTVHFTRSVLLLTCGPRWPSHPPPACLPRPAPGPRAVYVLASLLILLVPQQLNPCSSSRLHCQQPRCHLASVEGVGASAHFVLLAARAGSVSLGPAGPLRRSTSVRILPKILESHCSLPYSASSMCIATPRVSGFARSIAARSGTNTPAFLGIFYAPAQCRTVR